MINFDQNRRTFRSSVKSRAGKRLPGMEMYAQGVERKEVNVANGVLPIIRDGVNFRHNYDESHAVYETVLDESKVGHENLIEVSIDIDSSVATYISGESDFTNLVGQGFRLYNPLYVSDQTVAEYWDFQFTNDEGVDPRWLYKVGGLYNTSRNGVSRGRYGNSFNANLRYHLLKPIPNMGTKHEDFALTHETELSNYGAYDSVNGVYKIPLGFDPTKVDLTGEPSDYDSGLLNPANFDLSNGSIYETLARNPYWLYAVVTRSLFEVLPAGYFEIVDPDNQNIPGLSAESGSLGLWNRYNYPYTSNSDLVIKLRYKGLMPDTNPSSNTSTGVDATLQSWDGTPRRRWSKLGYKSVERDPRMFYESKRSDFLKQSTRCDFNGYYDSQNGGVAQTLIHESGDIKFYGATRSSGTTILPYSSGEEISKYEETLNSQSTAFQGTLESEQVEIRKTQSYQTIQNSFEREFTYFEDVHYHDPNQQTWTEMQEKRDQFVDAADHGGDTTAAFIQHIENLIDYRYSPMRLHPEDPMSGRIDVFNSIRSYYDNMPEAVLSNTKKSTSAQSFDLKSTSIMKDTYFKKSEFIDIKKFEDVNGVRDEGSPEYHVIKTSGTILSSELPDGSFVPLPQYSEFISYIWRRQETNAGFNITFTIEYEGGKLDQTYETTSLTDFPTQGQPNSDTKYQRRVLKKDPGDAVMFNDYFDQEEPDVLDYVEEDRWSRVDNEIIVYLTQMYHDDDDDISTPQVATGRSFEIDRRDWQQSDYLYTNTGHTTVHFQRRNGIVSKEYKR